jgi:cysteine desulfuration protein SufE
LCKGWENKYEYIIELGYELQSIPKEYKINERQIKECQSKAWLYAELVDGKVNYYADSEAVIIKGIIAMIIHVVSNSTPKEILESDLFFIEKTGLLQHFSNRSTGLFAMLDRIKKYALSFSTPKD